MEPLRRFDASQGPRIVGPADGKALDLGPAGVRFMLWGEETGGGFSLVEHPVFRFSCRRGSRHGR